MTRLYFYETDDASLTETGCRQRMWSLDIDEGIGPRIGVGARTDNGTIVSVERAPDRSGTYRTDTGHVGTFGPRHHSGAMTNGGPVLVLYDGAGVREVPFADPTEWKWHERAGAAEAPP